MGCRCNERGQALSRAAKAAVSGNAKGVGQNLAYVGRTLSQDLRSGAVKAAAVNRLAQMRSSFKR